MTYDPARHHRRSIRLKGYDYTQAGAYFVTLCVQGRECLLGDVVDGELQMNESGQIAAECWDDMARHFPAVELDASIIMPNHLHGIVIILPHTAVTDASVSKGVVTSQGEIVGKGAVPRPNAVRAR